MPLSEGEREGSESESFQRLTVSLDHTLLHAHTYTHTHTRTRAHTPLAREGPSADAIGSDARSLDDVSNVIEKS